MNHKTTAYTYVLIICCIALIFTGCDALLDPPTDVTGVTITQDDQAIIIGDTLQLTVTVAPAEADVKTVGWSSSDTSVATVSDTGLVSAVAAGTATITVTTTDQGKTDTIDITVSGGYVTLSLTNKANASDIKSYTLASGPDTTDAVFNSMATFLRDEEATHVIIAMGDPATAGSMILASSEPMGTDGMGGFFPTDSTYPFTSFYLFAPNAVDAASAVGSEIDLWMFELLSMSDASTTTESMSLSGSDTVTIEFDAFGALNEYVRGTFSGTCTDSVPETPVAYDVSGSFVALRAEVSAD